MLNTVRKLDNEAAEENETQRQGNEGLLVGVTFGPLALMLCKGTAISQKQSIGKLLTEKRTGITLARYLLVQRVKVSGRGCTCSAAN